MREYDFTGKTVIVTGAMDDIGKAVVDSFLRNGANVVASDLNEKPEVMEEFRKVSERIQFVTCDICDWDEDVRLVDEALHRFGGLDILVNNAGINESSS